LRADRQRDKDIMNLLLYMLGRAFQTAPALRPTPRQTALVRAAHAAARDNLTAALDIYRTLADSQVATTLDILICGHLLLIHHEPLEARLCFAEGITRLYQPGVDDAATALERLLEEANEYLNRGNPELAAVTIRRARTLLEVLLAAESGLLLATNGHIEDTPLAVLSGLGNLTLRLLVRARFAGTLVSSLRARRLHADFAPRMTADHLQSVLCHEESRLAELAARYPDHAEVQYRLGLVAGAAAHGGQAVGAFRTVLALHPYHVSSAVRLAAADPAVGLPLLRQAFAVPGETLHLFAALAHAAGDARNLDRVMNCFCAAAPQGDPTAARGNIAFALSELALLTEAQQSWREPTPV
jgi:hypothetical protein